MLVSEKYKINKVYCIIGPPYWEITKNNKTVQAFEAFEGAQFFIRNKTKQAIREMTAYSKIRHISVNLLTIQENIFIRTLLAKKCAGITKRQYGWLSGIYERQQAEW